jgi:Tfp pilus assembly protein PilN
MRQINLNQPELWPRPIPFSARHMLLALAVLLGVGAAAYGTLHYRIASQQAALSQLEQERESVRAELESRREANRQRQQALERLEGKVDGLRSRLEAYRQGRRAMERRLAAAGKKTALVRGLGQARQGRPHVWLTRFRLAGVGEVDVTLEGRARVPESIPRYLQAVADQSAFRKGFFQDLSAREPEGGDGRLQFSSKTRFTLEGATENGAGR